MAFRAALTGRQGPAFLEIPTDVLFRKVEEDSVVFPEAVPAAGPRLPRPQGAQAGRRRHPQRRAPGDHGRQRHLLGGGARRAAQVRRDCVQAPVYLNAMGRGSISQDHELFFSRSRRGALSKGDAIVVIGTPMDFRLGYGKRF